MSKVLDAIRSQKICGCGTCDGAMERATQFVCKMLDDNECPSFVIAVSYALAEIGTNTMDSLCIEYPAERGKIHNKFTALYGSLNYLYAKDESYRNLINDHIKKYWDRAEEEAKLPKDT